MSLLKSCTNWCSLIVLLMLFHVVLGIFESFHETDKLHCSLDSEDELYVRFILPERFGGGPEETYVYYKMETSKTWTLVKTYNTSRATEIADRIRILLQPTTLYEVKVSYEWAHNGVTSDLGNCQFCSQTDILEPVRNLNIHSVSPNWFALTWTMPDRICPKNVHYEITYHDEREPAVWDEWEEITGYPLVLSTGEHYVLIENGVQPNKTYQVWFVLKVEQGRKFRSKVSKITVQTLPGLGPPVVSAPPVILAATNSTLRVKTVNATCKNNCSVNWQYKEPEERTWLFAGKKGLNEEIEISSLKATTVYQVRALLQRSSDCAPYESDEVPFAENTTLPIAEPKITDEPPVLVNATNTTLTLETNCHEECKGYIAHWEYKKYEDHLWKYAGQQSTHRCMTISGLDPNTNYEVRYNLQWPTGRRIVNESGPETTVKTCSNGLLPVHYMWTSERKQNSLTILWSYQDECIPPYALVRWKSFDADDSSSQEYPSSSYHDNNCPINSTVLETRNLTRRYNTDLTYTINTGIVPGTRYLIEVVNMNWEGKCSRPETTKTSSPYKYWGGISVGLWCLIIFGVILLVASVPLCFAVRKRLAIRIGAGRDVAFSSASSTTTGNHEEGNGDGDRIIFPELSSEIMERHTQPSIS